MHAASCGVISFFTLSRSMGKIFCTKASSCCLNSSAGYLASTCDQGAEGRGQGGQGSAVEELQNQAARQAGRLAQRRAIMRWRGAGYLAEAARRAAVDGGLAAAG